MKKTISAILPFFCMFVLSTGSVALSCATAPRAKDSGHDAIISLNAGANRDGKICTVRVLDRIQSVILIDERDRSRKIELGPTEWTYDPATTEISILRDIPFERYFASIDGFSVSPQTFVLNGIKDETELLVIVSDRLAIEGYDYAFDVRESTLTFRKDVNLNDSDWSIQYSTPQGGSMIGEWKPENADRMSCLEAEHRRRWLDSWYDRQTAFWFLDETRMGEWKEHPDQPPVLIRRAATPKELADMKSIPVSVMKFRTETSDRDLARETGFDARIPKKLGSDSTHGELPLAWKTIEEYSRNGNLVKKLDVAYGDVSGTDPDRYLLNITMEMVGADVVAIEESGWIIDEVTIDLGLPVKRVRQWGLQTTDIDAKPTVARFTTWTWTEGSVRCQTSADSENDARTAELLRQFIAARMRTK